MIVNLSPQRRDDSLELHRTGDTLIVNGEAFNFHPLGEGDRLPAEAMSSGWFAGPVTRINGELELTILLPLPANYSPAQAFPEPVVLKGDGPVPLPPPLPLPRILRETQA
jgi:hypothetical protein